LHHITEATKCGTGFTDEDLGKLPKMLKSHVVGRKHARVQSLIEAEVWFEPNVVLEVLGAEVRSAQFTRAPQTLFAEETDWR